MSNYREKEFCSDSGLTFPEAYQLHKKLWSWLAENPGCCKRDWPGWAENGGDAPPVLNHCFACEIAQAAKRGDCTLCPIEWPGGYCANEQSPFSKFCNAPDIPKRVAAAQEIATLPWRKRS